MAKRKLSDPKTLQVVAVLAAPILKRRLEISANDPVSHAILVKEALLEAFEGLSKALDDTSS